MDLGLDIRREGMVVWRESDSEGKGEGNSCSEEMWEGSTEGENIRVLGKIEDINLDTALQT